MNCGGCWPGASFLGVKYAAGPLGRVVGGGVVGLSLGGGMLVDDVPVPAGAEALLPCTALVRALQAAVHSSTPVTVAAASRRFTDASPIGSPGSDFRSSLVVTFDAVTAFTVGYKFRCGDRERQET